MPSGSMNQYSPESRITRRNVLAFSGAAAILPLAGCEDQRQEVGNGGGQSQNGYGEFRDAIDAVADPWQRTPDEVTAEMVSSVVNELDDLAEAAIRGGDIGAMNAIINATRIAFEQLLEAKRALSAQSFRNEAITLASNDESLRSDYPEGYGYTSARPYYRLFQALEQGYDGLAQEDSEERRAEVVEVAEDIEVVFQGRYLRFVNQSLPDDWESPDSVDDLTGDHALAYTLKFLFEAAKWTVENL